ncbi:MAG TPA: Maf family protein [Rhodocyclaceae bacterium]|nr:Maf family protein [Rhodocyclaceae bacterium]
MAQPASRLYLASRSPRRRELLQQLGVAFDTLLFRTDSRTDPEIDEAPLPGEAPLAYVERIARAKAAYGVKLIGARHLRPQPVLSADTTLEFGGEIIGKPVDHADAAAILRRLSGQTHRVLTAVAVASGPLPGQYSSLGGDPISCRINVSEVRFKPLSNDEIARYVASGEPMDKAGAYGIQGRAGRFVEHLTGSYTGVMGLPLYETGELLGSLGFKV